MNLLCFIIYIFIFCLVFKLLLAKMKGKKTCVFYACLQQITFTFTDKWMCESVFDSCVCAQLDGELRCGVESAVCRVYHHDKDSWHLHSVCGDSTGWDSSDYLWYCDVYCVHKFLPPLIHPSMHSSLPCGPFLTLSPIPPISPLELGSFLRLDSWHQSPPPLPLLWLLIQ